MQTIITPVDSQNTISANSTADQQINKIENTAAPVGHLIRNIRRQQGRTQEDIAKIGGFTKSLLSRIETGDVNPPVGTLVKIAGALNVNLAALLETGSNTGSVFTSAKEAKTSLAATEIGYETYAYASNRSGKKCQPYLFEIKKGTLRRHSVTHTGEEFIYVITGSIRFHVGNINYTMNAGDTLYFDALHEHGVEAISDEATYLDVFC
jgi:transcriptional regulator with XRE-family HTH domain